ncbi:MAG: hypothetical protein JST92_02695, partial [Deltaproteobacteria bacterium]|nr:hypothetical protein [Deltaproteobacteria bacterium]
MEGAAALRTDAREEAIELQVELGGLAVALALRGPGAPGLARALAVHRVARGRQVVPLSRDEQVARLALSLDCEDGLAPTFDALSLTPIADALRCEGDGLDGTIATDAAELIIHG